VLIAEAYAWNVMADVVARIPEAVALASPHLGLTRVQTERLANLAMVFMAVALNDDLAEMGLPEVALPHPTEWPARINWPALFDEAGVARPEAAALA